MDTYSNVGQGASSVPSFSLTSTLGDHKPSAALFLLAPQTTDPVQLLHLPCILLAVDNNFCSRKALLLSCINTFKKSSICKKKTLNMKQGITDSQLTLQCSLTPLLVMPHFGEIV